MNKFDLNNEPIKAKYSSKAAAFYRKKLVAICNGSEEADEVEPSFDEGRKGENGEPMEEEKAPQEEEVRIAPQEEEEKKEAPHKIGPGEEQELQDMQQ